MNIVLGSIIWLFFICLIFICRPKSNIYNITVGNLGIKEKMICTVIMVITIISCTYLMALPPNWNGQNFRYRNQYEEMTNSILEGRLNLEYDDCSTDGLKKLQNPYDPIERNNSGVKYKWDHAYFNGNYYMYFGIVPVFILFLPLKVLAGINLLSYQATQIFTTFIIIGIFAFFYFLSKKFFKSLPWCLYVLLSAAFSLSSVWYFVDAPALYCLAISSAVALELWSLFLFFKAVWIENTENKQILYAFLGSFLGALTFGCRPTVALGNLLVIPMVAVFLKQRKFSFKLLLKLFVAALPYLVIGILLMSYNYARFDDPFEFGQSYQLTIADQTIYNSMNLLEIDWLSKISSVRASFLSFSGFSDEFPYINHNGIFINFPIYFLMVCLFKNSVQNKLKENNLKWYTYTLLALPIIISFSQILWSPGILERYHSDIYFIMAIACYMLLCFWIVSCKNEKKKRRLQAIIMYFGIFTIISSILLYCVPCDGNLTEQFPEILHKIKQILFFNI